MASGWVKIHRKITNCELWDNDEPFDRRSAWIDLILLCNHEGQKCIVGNEVKTLLRGQCHVSIRKLSERWHWGKTRVSNYLKLLEELGMITYECDTKMSILSVVNYKIYQCSGQESEDTNEDTNEDTSNPINYKVCQGSEQGNEDTKKTPSGTPSGTLTRTPTRTRTRNIRNIKERNTKERKVERFSLPDDFGKAGFTFVTDDGKVIQREKVWQDTFNAYPKKEKEEYAKREWSLMLCHSVNPLEVARLILKAVRLYVARYKENNPNDEELKYMPYFGNWLKNESADYIKRIENGEEINPRLNYLDELIKQEEEAEERKKRLERVYENMKSEVKAE